MSNSDKRDFERTNILKLLKTVSSMKEKNSHNSFCLMAQEINPAFIFQNKILNFTAVMCCSGCCARKELGFEVLFEVENVRNPFYKALNPDFNNSNCVDDFLGVEITF